MQTIVFEAKTYMANTSLNSSQFLNKTTIIKWIRQKLNCFISAINNNAKQPWNVAVLAVLVDDTDEKLCTSNWY